MPNKGRGSSQATISSFFQSSPEKTKAKKRMTSPVRVDLTVDSGDEPPTKKIRMSGPGDALATRAVAGRSSGAAEQWRFTSVSSDKLDLHPIKQRTKVEVLTQEERQKAFKKKLLLENNPFLRKKADAPAARIELDGSDSEESDHAFKELNEMFSNKAKGKGKSKVSIPARPSKKPILVGPSGQSYTPLENQVGVASRTISDLSYTLLCLRFYN